MNEDRENDGSVVLLEVPLVPWSEFIENPAAANEKQMRLYREAVDKAMSEASSKLGVTDCAKCDPTCARCVRLLEQEEEIERLLEERHVDRVLSMALVDALPRCSLCVKPATWEHGDPYDPMPACDEHVASVVERRWEMTYAEQLRAFAARMSTWLRESPR